MVFVGDRRLFVLQWVLHTAFGIAAIAQIFALNSWADFDRPVSLLSMWSAGSFPALETVSAERCAQMASGLNGMSECLESPYFNYSEQRWRQNVNRSASKPDEDSCEAYMGFQGAVQTYWQDESRIDCVPYYPPLGKAYSNTAVSFITAAQETPFTCSAGQDTSCVFNYTLPEKRLTIYDDVELGRLNAITTVWDLSYKVKTPEITILDQNDQVLEVVPQGKLLSISLSTVLRAAGIQLDDINPLQDSPSWAPSYRFTGVQLLARLRYRNLEAWSTTSNVKAELRINALEGQWVVRNLGFKFRDDGTSGTWHHQSEVYIDFLTEGQLGHFTWTALTNAVLNAVVLVGMASMVVNNYTRHLHYLIIALEPKNLSEPLRFDSVAVEDGQDQPHDESSTDEVTIEIQHKEVHIELNSMTAGENIPLSPSSSRTLPNERRIRPSSPSKIDATKASNQRVPSKPIFQKKRDLWPQREARSKGENSPHVTNGQTPRAGNHDQRTDNTQVSRNVRMI